MKKLTEFMSEDIDLLKKKSENLEDIVRNIRTEFFNNLNDVEQFFTKKFESLFRTLDSNGRQHM